MQHGAQTQAVAEIGRKPATPILLIEIRGKFRFARVFVRSANRANLIFAGNYRQKGTTMKKTTILIAALAMFTVTARGILADGPIPPDPQAPRPSEVRWLVADGPIPPDPQPPRSV